MTITFPDDMREMLEREAREAGMPSVDVYLLTMYARAKHYFGVNGELLWNDASGGEPTGQPWPDPATRKRLLELAEEGLNSGPPVPVTPEFWEDLKRKVEERLSAKRAVE